MSPLIWSDARPRIATVAAAQGVFVDFPNEDAGERPEPPAMWLAIDFASDVASKYEMGADVWLEEGAIWLHLFIPNGTGIENGLAVRKQFSLAFRSIQSTVEGLGYLNQTFEPVGPDDGVYKRLPLLIRYAYLDIVT